MTGISSIVTRGFGSWGSVNDIPTRGFGIGVPASIGDVPGMEAAVGDYRLHVTLDDKRVHARTADNRLHWQLPER